MMAQSFTFRRPKVFRRCGFLFLGCAFYVAIFLNILGWHDNLRSRFSQLNSSDFGRMSFLVSPSSDSRNSDKDHDNKQEPELSTATIRQQSTFESNVEPNDMSLNNEAEFRFETPFLSSYDRSKENSDSSQFLKEFTLPGRDAVLPKTPPLFSGGVFRFGKDYFNSFKRHYEGTQVMNSLGGVSVTIGNKHNTTTRAPDLKTAGSKGTQPSWVQVILGQPSPKDNERQLDEGTDSRKGEKVPSEVIASEATLPLRKPQNAGDTVGLEPSGVAVFDNNSNLPQVLLSDDITPESPVFVLSLPNNGDVSIQRYFQCAGLDETTLGRRFTQDNLYSEELYKRKGIGKCLWRNIQEELRSNSAALVLNSSLASPPSFLDPLQGCGGYRVWTEMDYISKGLPKEIRLGGRRCIFPTLKHNVVHRLLQAYPNATVINVIRDPEEWYSTLSTGELERWPRWCNNGLIYQFPQANATKEEWIQFYNQHTNHLRSRIQKHHPSVKFIEVDLDINARETARILDEHLGIPETCWLDQAIRKDKRPRARDIRYPIFVPSLPKSATTTTHSYLNCGMGSLEGAHQWTQRENSTKDITIGECMQDNIRQNRSIIEGCGDHKHWSDIGVLRPENCFYPSMHGGLEAMYQAHPYGTILNTVRDAKKWVKSAKKWQKLLLRWSLYCEGFPPPKSKAKEWIEFYNQHNQQIRDFAKEHPTMTYVEINVENETETQEILAETFGFPGRCWGHENSNFNNSAIIRYEASVERRRGAKNQTLEADGMDLNVTANVTITRDA